VFYFRLPWFVSLLVPVSLLSFPNSAFLDVAGCYPFGRESLLGVELGISHRRIHIEAAFSMWCREDFGVMPAGVFRRPPGTAGGCSPFDSFSGLFVRRATGFQGEGESRLPGLDIQTFQIARQIAVITFCQE